MIIVQQRAALESETIVWLANVIANGGTVSEATLRANDNLIKDLKANSLRSLIQHLITYSGNNLASGLCPIIYDIGSSIATNNNFVAGDFSETGGLGNAANSSRYLSLGFTDSQIGSANSYSYTGVLVGQAVNLAIYSQCGTGDASDTQLWRVAHANGDGAGVFSEKLGGATLVAVTQTAKSVVTISRTSNVYLRAYVNGTGGTAVTTSTTSTPQGVTMVTHARAKAGSAVASFDPNFHLVDCFGSGLNDTQAANLATCLNSFKTRMGR